LDRDVIETPKGSGRAVRAGNHRGALGDLAVQPPFFAPDTSTRKGGGDAAPSSGTLRPVAFRHAAWIMRLIDNGRRAVTRA